MSDLTPEQLVNILRHKATANLAVRKPTPAARSDAEAFQDAADAITALRAEVERLKNLATREAFKRDEMLGRVNAAEAERDRWKAAAYKDFADSVAACAERDKLREALRQIAERDEGSDPRFTDRMIARAALQGEGWR